MLLRTWATPRKRPWTTRTSTATRCRTRKKSDDQQPVIFNSWSFAPASTAGALPDRLGPTGCRHVPCPELFGLLGDWLRMPPYYFDVIDGHGIAEDEDGLDLPDAEAARAEALAGARGILADEVKTGRIDLSWRIDVRDETHEFLFSVPFAEAIEIA